MVILQPCQALVSTGWETDDDLVRYLVLCSLSSSSGFPEVRRGPLDVGNIQATLSSKLVFPWPGPTQMASLLTKFWERNIESQQQVDSRRRDDMLYYFVHATGASCL